MASLKEDFMKKAAGDWENIRRIYERIDGG